MKRKRKKKERIEIGVGLYLKMLGACPHYQRRFRYLPMTAEQIWNACVCPNDLMTMWEWGLKRESMTMHDMRMRVIERVTREFEHRINLRNKKVGQGIACQEIRKKYPFSRVKPIYNKLSQAAYKVYNKKTTEQKSRINLHDTGIFRPDFYEKGGR